MWCRWSSKWAYALAPADLAISTMADRAKTKYGFALIPDEALSDPAQVVERAVAWLQTGT